MAALVRIAANLGAILAPHISIQFVDWSSLRPTNDIQRHRLVRVATKAFDFEIEITSIERVADAWRRLGRSLKAEHPLVPGDTCEPVSLLARFFRALCGRADRTAVDRLSRLSAHSHMMRPVGWKRQAAMACGLLWEAPLRTAASVWGPWPRTCRIARPNAYQPENAVAARDSRSDKRPGMTFEKILANSW
jgi:hypothetical protein